MRQQETGERWWSEADRDPIHAEAADWFARLREPDVSVEDTLAWQNWMSADRRHAEAFARIEEVSSVLHSMPHPSPPRAFKARWDDYDGSQPISDWRGRPRLPRTLAIAASMLVATVALALLVVNHDTLPAFGPPAVVLETIIGENRIERLADGSVVTLGGNSRIEVSLRDDTRWIRLAHGEAFFAVAKDPSRAFKVHAGRATVVALGTKFNVRRGEERVVVNVVEGRVIVEPTSSFVPMAILSQFRPRLVPVRVAAGEETMVSDIEVEPATRVADAAAAPSWQTGRLAFRLQPLRYVLEDVNRYAPKPIVLGDDRIGDLRVTGTVVGNNVSGWVASLESALEVDATEEPDRIVLRNRQRAAAAN